MYLLCEIPLWVFWAVIIVGTVILLSVSKALFMQVDEEARTVYAARSSSQGVALDFATANIDYSPKPLSPLWLLSFYIGGGMIVVPGIMLFVRRLGC